MSDIARVLRDFTDKYDVTDIPVFFVHYVRTVLLPLGILCLCAAGALKLLHAVFRTVIPPPHPKRYDQIKTIYRKGYPEQALYEWKRDLPTYPPAILSRACHEIYVARRTKKGMELLQVLLRLKESKEYLREVENMKADALAIQHGNARMVDMNAIVAKQEHLGISTP
eukprot:CAMPEP_0117035222 /NCGR_PEP_ID=MMETSP0472-20121206/25029_1 /TAXON_ID=693140 ORGANISM="Tiarina fusus, Strain LIS" /NCGR_SAMPLE_ID=MMETSP0472 /ASSEMBLY_ACC=CAM_ASM_000603 /LENGTH=167 /DNA_ID=CAMNT_0004744629 /DNA_START=142 /DNA_END=645 /DNA_ORIENTATION=+